MIDECSNKNQSWLQCLRKNQAQSFQISMAWKRNVSCKQNVKVSQHYGGSDHEKTPIAEAG